MKVFDQYDNLYDEIYWLEYNAYDHNGYITEVILPLLDALMTFDTLRNDGISFYFGNTLDSFKKDVDNIFREVDFVLQYRI